MGKRKIWNQANRFLPPVLREGLEIIRERLFLLPAGHKEAVCFRQIINLLMGSALKRTSSAGTEGHPFPLGLRVKFPNAVSGELGPRGEKCGQRGDSVAGPGPHQAGGSWPHLYAQLAPN